MIHVNGKKMKKNMKMIMQKIMKNIKKVNVKVGLFKKKLKGRLEKLV